MLTRRSLFTLAFAQDSPAQQTPTDLQPAALACEVTPVMHLLSRLTYGVRPDELQRAEQMGYAATLDEQLDPSSLDDSQCDRLLNSLPILRMDRATAYKVPSPEYRTWLALLEGMIVRAIHSRRQLLERMVEFWSDHFNIPSDDYSPHLTEFQNRAIRPHALGKFQNMLIEVTKSPAMLYYLDNYANYAESPNENYGRELLELYTLGVDGGYTEADVKAVARALTGWTVHDGAPHGFYFNPDTHDHEVKQVLGHTLPAGRGIDDGYHVLNLLAHHPSTAQFVSRKLCVRFVSDTPPQSLVDSTAQVWRTNHGQIKPVLRHLFLSEEFKAAVGQKFRRPLDFFIGVQRATGTRVRDGETWLYEEMLRDLGQLPYGWHPPNGFPDMAGAWINSGGLLARWNIAMRLTHGAYGDANEWGWGLMTQLHERIGDPSDAGGLVDAVATQVFGKPLIDSQRDYYIAYLTDNAGNAATPINERLVGRKLGSLFGLMLASPAYQWR